MNAISDDMITKQWFAAEIVRVAPIEGEHTYSNNLLNAVEVSFAYANLSVGDSGYDFERCPIVEQRMPWAWFSQFAHSIGYVGSRDPADLFASDCPMLGLTFKVELDNMIKQGSNYFPASSGAAISALRPRNGVDLSAPDDFQVALDALLPETSPLIYDDSADREFEKLGWDVVERGADERPSPKGVYYSDFERRQAIFTGERWSAHKRCYVKGGGKRSFLLTYARHKRNPDLLVTFGTMAITPSFHVHFPIWQGERYWAHPRSDDDVTRIIRDCRRRAIPKQQEELLP